MLAGTIGIRRLQHGMVERAIRWLAAVLAASVVASAALDTIDADLLFGREVSVSNIRPEQGRAYLGQLSDPGLSSHEVPSSALLFQVRPRHGGFLHRLEPWLGESYLHGRLSRLYEVRFPDHTLVSRHRLGPGNALHDDIRTSGDGRYSVWHGSVYFSPPEKLGLSSADSFVLIAPTAASASVAEALAAVASVEATIGFRMPEDRRGNQMARLRAILAELDIPLLDLGPEFRRRGDPEDATIPNDGHLSPTGHLWVAAALADDIGRRGWLQGHRRAVEAGTSQGTGVE